MAERAMAERIRAVLDVALRVPCIFTIDAIFNSYSDLSAQRLGIVPQILLRLWGVLLSSIILVLSQQALFRFYRFSFALLLAVSSLLVNYHATLHINFYHAYYSATFGAEHLPVNGPSVWMSIIILQLIFGIGFVSLLQLHPVYSNLIILNLLLPVTGLILESPEHIQQILVLFSGFVLTSQTATCTLLKLRSFYYASRYVYLLIKHMYRVYGLQLLIEDTWKRIRLPDVLRVFWLTRLATQAVILVYVLKEAAYDAGDATYLISWDDFWDVAYNLTISGCDSTLTVMGMSAVISSIAHYLGLGILSFIGSTEEEDKRLGFVAPVLFFILALQTGLSGLKPAERLVRLSRNMCLLLTAILHFVHGMTDPVLMSLSASHVSSVRRHLPVLLVSTCLFVLPIFLSYILWHYYVLNTWLFAVTAFCVELCLKVIVSLTVYTLFMVDGYYNVLWEKLDDYVYYVRSTGNIIEFVFGVIMFGNGAYTMMFESGSKIRACMMCLHAYFNIYLQAKNGWKTFMNRRTAVKKINSLPEIKGSHLSAIDDVCAICYHEFQTAARVTPCHHYFHALCLRKWLYIQDTCPMCHQKVYLEDDTKEVLTVINNNEVAPEDEHVEVGAAAAPANELNAMNEDNDDSAEYDEEEWTVEQQNIVQQNIVPEEEYLNDTDSGGD